MTNPKDPSSPDDLNDEINRAMAEAEAAVTAMEGDADNDDPAADTATGLAAAVVELETELQATKDRWLRAVADLENYKKRVRREVDDAQVQAVQKLLPSFLPTMDNLERALEAAGPGASIDQLVRGIQMVRDEFMGALRKHNIEPVISVGVAFDPAVHDALQQVDSPDHAPGVVVREFERGYRMGERLLRPARVVIAGPGSTGAPPAGTTDSEA
ncbi:MAG: nucleotide exchange factor GrpE [Deltaproteobacteria bacterium]|nr:nucleotide exchange factor GrpE [Deltaproteobacteria bacterium]MBK8236535.1 nucleotide exchange factor GrpE [Deltaproteobacteria bacterium]MBK8717841.1 nucleotide exchange factor GrpE [Deltaproteobacteria bacterium]MBP7287797.1 nucleotide exchange factor GrpE [Nannocystaceae bacterium]